MPRDVSHGRRQEAIPFFHVEDAPADQPTTRFPREVWIIGINGFVREPAELSKYVVKLLQTSTAPTNQPTHASCHPSGGQTSGCGFLSIRVQATVVHQHESVQQLGGVVVLVDGDSAETDGTASDVDPDPVMAFVWHGDSLP